MPSPAQFTQTSLRVSRELLIPFEFLHSDFKAVLFSLTFRIYGSDVSFAFQIFGGSFPGVIMIIFSFKICWMFHSSVFNFPLIPVEFTTPGWMVEVSWGAGPHSALLSPLATTAAAAGLSAGVDSATLPSLPSWG